MFSEFRVVFVAKSSRSLSSNGLSDSLICLGSNKISARINNSLLNFKAHL